MQEFVRYLQQEWETLSSAPFTFIVAALLAGAVAYAAARFHYDTQIKSLEARMGIKNDQIADLRERLGIVVPDANSYERLTNQELAQRSTRLAERVRSLASRHHSEFNRLTSAPLGGTTEEMNEAFQARSTQLAQAHFDLMGEYESKYKAEAILLHSEMVSRIPARRTQPSRATHSLFDHPTNGLGLEDVAQELDLLARELPQREAGKREEY